MLLRSGPQPPNAHKGPYEELMTRLVDPGIQWYTLVNPVVLWYTLPLPICNGDRLQYLLFHPEKDKVVKKLEIIILENRVKCILL